MSNEFKNYNPIAGVRKKTTSGRGEGNEAEFISIRLKPKTEENVFTKERALTRAFFADSDAEAFEKLNELVDFNGDKPQVKDWDKLKTMNFPAKQVTFEVNPFYRKDANGNYIKFASGPDKGKQRIADRVTTLVIQGEDEQTVKNAIERMNADDLVNFEKVTTNEYADPVTLDIIKEYKGESGGEEGVDMN